MLTNFEELTCELSQDELDLVPIIMGGFKTRTEKNPIKAPEIVAGMDKWLKENRPDVKIKMSEVRLRKIVNHIRSNSIAPLIATSHGYYLSNDPEVIKSQVKSMYERAASIKKAADGLSLFLISEGRTP